MKIGIFDSGLGGLIIARAIFKKLPKYDYVYLGDTKRVPYGDQDQETIFIYTRQAIDFLFKQNCMLIIVACNTASAMALRRIQREYLPKYYPNRRVLGVIAPTIESIIDNVGADTIRPKKIGVLATSSTVDSGAFKRELAKINSKIKIVQKKAPLLVPLIENNALQNIGEILKSYIRPLKDEKVGDILLGCSHYPILKDKIKKIAGKKIKVISQEEIIPGKLKDYLKRHSEINNKLSKKGKRVFEVTDKNTNFDAVAKTLFGKKINFKLVDY
jgi:glutamate racemase